MRDLLSRIDPETLLETDHNLLYFNFPLTPRDNAVIWVLGHYVQFVEEEVVARNKKATSSQFMGWLGAKALEFRYRAMPHIGNIPGIYPTGIG